MYTWLHMFGQLAIRFRIIARRFYLIALAREEPNLLLSIWKISIIAEGAPKIQEMLAYVNLPSREPHIHQETSNKLLLIYTCVVTRSDVNCDCRRECYIMELYIPTRSLVVHRHTHLDHTEFRFANNGTRTCSPYWNL